MDQADKKTLFLVQMSQHLEDIDWWKKLYYGQSEDKLASQAHHNPWFESEDPQEFWDMIEPVSPKMREEIIVAVCQRHVHVHPVYSSMTKELPFVGGLRAIIRQWIPQGAVSCMTKPRMMEKLDKSVERLEQLQNSEDSESVTKVQ